MEKDIENKNIRLFQSRVCMRALLLFLGVVLMQALAYLVCMAGLFAYGKLSGKQGTELLYFLADVPKEQGFLIGLSLVSASLSGVWCGILYRRSPWREPGFDYRQAFSGKDLLAICGTGVGGCIVLTVFLSVVSVLFPQGFTSYNALMEELSDWEAPLTALYVMLVGPVSEEWIFRGALLDRFYLAFPFWAANLMQALLFGVYHMNLIQGLYAFCIGLLFGMIRQASGTIVSSMLAHILFNAASYGLDRFFPESGSGWALALLCAAGAAAFAGGFRHFLRKYRERKIQDSHRHFSGNMV